MQAGRALVKAHGLTYISGKRGAVSERRGFLAMNQRSRIFDDLGKLMNDAAGVADGVRREIETAVKSQAERFIADMDLVKREDFDILRELVQAQGEEIAALRKELSALRSKKKAE
jgi:BMFP domain-containing protein YqiC